MTTIKEIAELAGVSRGTVDRVLNNRGSVNPKTAEKIQNIAQALDYHPNRAGIVLAAQKKKIKIGTILPSTTNLFFDDIERGILEKAEELNDYGVSTLFRRDDWSLETQIRLMDEMAAEGCNGLIIAPSNEPELSSKINQLKEAGIPVITVNTDIDGSSRIAYVGSDYIRGGNIAAGLMNLMTDGHASIGILSGSEDVLCHTERIKGFRQTISASYPNLEVKDLRLHNDDEFVSYTMTQKMLQEHPEIDALFFVSAAVNGGCKAAIESGRKLKIVTFDEVSTTRRMLNDGVISATISQRAAKQGYLSLELLFDYLATGQMPEHEFNYIEHAIKIRENL